MNPLEFEKLVKKINHEKYHVSRTMQFDNIKGPYISEWAIFRKDMSIEEYFDPKNLAILSSKNGNTIEDIIEFIDKE